MNIFVVIAVFGLLIVGNYFAFRYIPAIGNAAARWVLIVAVVVVDLIILWRLLNDLGIPDVRV